MMTSDSLDRLTGDLLTSLAETPDLLDAMVAETGLDPGDLRRLAASKTRDLSAALLDFFCADDDRLLRFSEQSGWPAERVAYARAALEAGKIG